MSTSSPAARRREKQLQELLEGKNFKQALSLCEKNIKKGDKSEHLLITKIHILLAQPEQARQKQGRRELDEVLGRSVPISEISALTAIDAAANARGDNDPRIEEIWERAHKVKPYDEDIYICWFEAKFRKKKWKAAQKASMLYMKNFPEKREPFFWNIICCELAGSDQSSSELDRKILRPLAFGFLSKAASEVGKKEISNSGRFISNTEELLLLLRIYRSQNKNQEALAVLNSLHIGINSPIGKDLWELVRQKLELCELCQCWDDQWKFCKELLEDAHPSTLRETRTSYHRFGESGDDWRIWIGLITAAYNIDTSVCAKLTEDLIISYIKPSTISRNARLALLKFYSLDTRQDNTVQDNLLSACQEYFSDYSQKVVCFSDLQPYVACLEISKQEVLLNFAAQHCRNQSPDSTDSIYQQSKSKSILWITSETNLLKLDYFIVVSRIRGIYNKNLLEAFIGNCLRLYTISLSLGSDLPISERQPGDDAAVLAVMALMRLLELGENNAPLRCIIILEFLISRSKSNYDAMLILVRLHLQFGSGWLAMEHYSRLSIKNLQHATMSWILFTRISTIHPFVPAIARARQSPTNIVKSINLGIEWHDVASKMNNNSMSQMIEEGKYNMFFDSLSNDSFLSEGFAKYMLLAESDRVFRFSERFKSSDHQDCLDRLPPQTKETRDLTIFPDCEASGERRFSERLDCGPLPNHQWLGMQVRTNQLWEFLQANRQGFDVNLADQMAKHNKIEENSLTDVEVEFDSVVQNLLTLCAAYYYKSQDSSLAAPADLAHTLLKSLCSWYSETASNSKPECVRSDKFVYNLDQDFAIPDWRYFHTNYLSLEICRLTKLTLDYVLTENRVYKLIDPAILNDLSANIKQWIENIITNIGHLASTLQEELRKPSNIGKQLELILGRPDEAEDQIGQELRKLVGVEKTKELAADMCTSWTEALDGIHRLRNA